MAIIIKLICIIEDLLRLEQKALKLMNDLLYSVWLVPSQALPTGPFLVSPLAFMVLSWDALLKTDKATQ